MAVGLLNQWNAAVGNVDFQHTIRMAILQQVARVLAEPPTTPNHAQRLALAAKSIANPNALDNFVQLGTLFLAAQGLDVSSPDAIILSAIGPLVDMFALAPLP